MQTERVFLEGDDDPEFPNLALGFEIPLYVCQLEGDDLERLNNDLFNATSELCDRFMDYGRFGPESGGMTADDISSFTDYFQFYNIFYLDDPAIEALFLIIREAHERMLDDFGVDKESISFTIQGWGNMVHGLETQNFVSHRHQHHAKLSYMTANYCVTADSETATVMELPARSEDYEIVNQPGQISFFPLWLPHYTTPEQRDRWRVTISSNIVPLSFSRDYDNVSEWKDRGVFGGHRLPFYLPPHLWAELNGNDVRDFRFVHEETVGFMNKSKGMIPDDCCELVNRWDP